MLKTLQISLFKTLCFLTIISLSILNVYAEPSNRNQEIPDIYRPYIVAAQNEHPNWNFEFLYTGIEWADAVENENRITETSARSLISGKTTPKEFWSTNPLVYNEEDDTYKAMDGSSWYAASEEVVKHYMDPRNFLNECDLFQFEELEFNKEIHNINGVKSILKDSFMDETIIETESGEITYAEAFMLAGERYNVSPYHLASKSLQEVGRDGSGSVSGKYPGYHGIYNYYNIGAWASAHPISNGLAWAANSEKETFNRPWDSPYKSIMGGADFISNVYINKGQDTLYLEKFDLDDSFYGRYSHQYMQNISGAVDECEGIYKAYRNSDMLTTNFTFIIPVYDNMPEERQCLPCDETLFDCELHPEDYQVIKNTNDFNNEVGVIGDIDSDEFIEIIDANQENDINFENTTLPTSININIDLSLNKEKENENNIIVQFTKTEAINVQCDKQKELLEKIIEENNVLCIVKEPSTNNEFFVNDKGIVNISIPKYTKSGKLNFMKLSFDNNLDSNQEDNQEAG